MDALGLQMGFWEKRLWLSHAGTCLVVQAAENPSYPLAVKIREINESQSL